MACNCKPETELKEYTDTDLGNEWHKGYGHGYRSAYNFCVSHLEALATLQGDSAEEISERLEYHNSYHEELLRTLFTGQALLIHAASKLQAVDPYPEASDDEDADY